MFAGKRGYILAALHDTASVLVCSHAHFLYGDTAFVLNHIIGGMLSV
jgi:hypothetical protein